jgi:hypothetical protein
MMMEGEHDVSISGALHPGDRAAVGQPDPPACPESHGSNGAAKASSTAALIRNDRAGDALAAQLAVEASGNALAVWQQHDGTRANILANRYQ